MGKDNSLGQNQSTKTVNFWLCTGLLVVLLTSLMARDISRPFYGLHSWDEAAAAWRARAFLKYDLKYTKGFAVWAVGNPPTEHPNRSLDHPQLKLFMPAVEMLIFGINERATRIGKIIRAILSLLIFLRILWALLDEKTALLAGLSFVIFPITGYFGGRTWVMPIGLAAIWCYLVIIGTIKNQDEHKTYHKWLLAVLLFLILQMSWNGFFYALAIGVHYVFRCMRRRQWPQKSLLAILIIAPLSSLMLDFTVMAAGHGWQWQKIWALYKWRASTGELQNLTWPMWFGRFWQHGLTNFTLPVLITAIAYLTIGQLFAFITRAKSKTETVLTRRFPQFWLFLMPGVFQLLILRGALWPHQYWEYPLIPFIAIAVALAVMVLADILGKISRRLANAAAVAVMAVIFVSCTMGLNYYYNIRWQSPMKIKMFKELNKMIPPDKALLSYESFMVDQHPVKGPHYRPEIAWYLDREIVVARTAGDIEQKAKTGRYPYYLIPYVSDCAAVINQLTKRYKYQQYLQVPPDTGERTKDGRFLRASMMPYLIFDLRSSTAGN